MDTFSDKKKEPNMHQINLHTSVETRRKQNGQNFPVDLILSAKLFCLQFQELWFSVSCFKCNWGSEYMFTMHKQIDDAVNLNNTV